MTTTTYRAHRRAPEAGAPLIFAFHGTGGDETQFVPLLTALFPAAGIAAPRGDVSEHGAARYFRRRAEGVYDMDDLARRQAALAAWVRAEKAAYPDAPAYALGYSNGANILAAMSFADPSLFERIALMHPLIPWTPDPAPGLAGVATLITGGRRDPIAPLAGTEALADWYARQGAPVALALHDGGHEIANAEIEAVAHHFGAA